MQGAHRSLRDKPQAAEAATRRQRLLALRQVLLGRTLAPFWLSLALILAILPVISSVSQTPRMANLDLARGGFPHSYVMTSKTEPNRGYLVDRRDSTVRRSRKNVAGKMWDLDRFGEDTAAGIPEHFLLRSKRYGTVFFIPVEAVKDFSYPFIYSFVRREYPEFNLPEATWTQLFLNRVYHGLYLEMRLPFDLRKKDGGSGILRELFMVRDNEMTLADTRLNPDARFYEENTTLGLFPAFTQPPPVLAWLAARCPTEHATLLLSNVQPYEVSLLPLPYSVEQLYQRLRGTALQTTLDDRFRLWTAPLREQDDSKAPQFDQVRQEKFDQEFRDYSLRLQAALEADRVVHPEAVYSARLPLENLAGPRAMQSRGTWR